MKKNNKKLFILFNSYKFFKLINVFIIFVFSLSVKLIKKIYGFWTLNIVRKVLFFYIFCLIIGSVLLFLPFSYKTTSNVFMHSKYNFFDAFYTCVSALTNTGLLTTSIKNQFSTIGVVEILFLIQIGGAGLITLKVFLFMLFFKKIPFITKFEIENSANYNKSASSVKVIKGVIYGLIFIEIFATLIYFLYSILNHNQNSAIYKSGYNYKAPYSAFLNSIFLSVSGINNCGMDLFTSITSIYSGGVTQHYYASLANFSNDYFTMSFLMILTILGGIGFPIFYEVERNILYLFINKKKQIRFSFQIKFLIWSYFLITFISFFILLAIILINVHVKKDQIYNFSNKSVINQIFNILFLDITTRSSGFSTVFIGKFSAATQFVLIILMWIGTSPFSTGGGVRSTTVFVIIISIYSYFKNYPQAKLFKKYALPSNVVKRSYIVVFTSIILISVFLLIFLIYPWKHNSQIFFNTWYLISSFATTGLIIRPIINIPIFLSLISVVLMIIGQLTISNTLLLNTKKFNPLLRNYKIKSYPVTIG